MSLCGPCGDVHPAGTAICPRTQLPAAQVGPCGTRVDRYDVIRFLGGGGMGAVYLARHAMLGHAVALKLLRSGMAGDAQLIQRFMREAKAAASIPSAHIVKVADFGVAEATGQPFLVMELLEGSDLETLIRAERFLMPDRAVRLVLQILDGLVAAHALGIVHRDMKPPNVFVVRGPDGGDFAKIVDFGISKTKRAIGESHLTRTGMVMGTPHYMPPEQFKGARDVDARGDVYAVAVILYRMICGRMPHDGETYEQIVLSACTADPTPVRQLCPYVSEGLARAIELGLERNAGARWQTADIFRRALIDAANEGLIDPTHRGPILGPPPPPPRVPTMLTGESGHGMAPIAPPSWGSGAPPPPAHASWGPGSAPQARPVPGPRSVPSPRGGMPLWVPLLAVGALLLAAGAFGATVWLGADDPAPAARAVGAPGPAPQPAIASLVPSSPLAPYPYAPQAAPPAPVVGPAGGGAALTPIPLPPDLPPHVGPHEEDAEEDTPRPRRPESEQPSIASRSVRIDYEITGLTLESSERFIREALLGLRPELDRCRDEHDHEFRVSMHVPSGGRIVSPSSAYRQPAASCAVRAIRSLGSFRIADPDASGIVTATVTLPAR